MIHRQISMLAALVTFALSCQVATADLIAHYKFDGDPTDEVDNAFNEGFEDGDATPSGPNTGFDGTGEAYEFSGAGHIILPIDLGPEQYPDLTVTMWVKPDESIINSPGLYKTFGHDDGGWDRTFGLDNRNGPYRYAAFTGGAGPGPTNDTGTAITSEWTFLAAVWDTLEDDPVDVLAAPAQVTFYAGANSITQDLTNTTSGLLEAAVGNLRPDNFNEGWRGLIDDVRIFDNALTEADIDEIRFFDKPDLVGDANADGVVDLDDYDLIQANSFTVDAVGDPRLGDLNGDQFVDFLDFRVWKEAFPGGVAAADAALAARSVPEPASWGIAVGLIGWCVLARRRRGAAS